jgi:hypothetical protein
MTWCMDPVAAVRATSATADTSTTDTSTTSAASSATPSKDFASFLKDGESLTTVSGHSGYEKIAGGKRDGEYLNTSLNKRNGQAFEIEKDAGKVIHMYGKLKVVVVEKAAATTTTGGAAATTPQSSSTPSSSSSSSSS